MINLSKRIIAGFMVAIVLGGILGFGLAYVFLNQPDYTGRILQTKFISKDSSAIIYNTTMTKQGVTDMFLTILTTGDSYLLIRFNSIAFHTMFDFFDGISSFVISLELNGISQRNIILQYAGQSSNGLQLTDSITLEYVTTKLPANTYSINLTWYSVSNCRADPGFPDASSLQLGSTQNSRTLLIQEIHI